MRFKDKKTENKIKEILLKKLMDTNLHDDCFAINEFGIANFTRRVDIILCKKESILAFEIKSEFDSLNRLSGQITEYLNHFDKVTVIAASKHIKNVLIKTPSNVAVWEVTNSVLKIRRPGRTIPIKNKYVFIRMMTLSELKSLAKKIKINTAGMKRIEIEGLLGEIPLKTLRAEAFSSIKLRYKKRSINYFDNSESIAKNLRAREKNKPDLQSRKKSNTLDDFLNAIEKLQP